MAKILNRSEQLILDSYSTRIEIEDGEKIYIGCFGGECIEFCKGFIDPKQYTTRVLKVDYDGYVSKSYAISDDIDEFEVLARGFLKKLIITGHI